MRPGFHSVMDKPDSVRRVMPPTMIMRNTSAADRSKWYATALLVVGGKSNDAVCGSAGSDADPDPAALLARADVGAEYVRNVWLSEHIDRADSFLGLFAARVKRD